jgi:hypothetical protein
MSTSGRVRVITGTGGSIGRAAAVAFAREGASVAGRDLNVDASEATVETVRGPGGTRVSLQPRQISVTAAVVLAVAGLVLWRSFFAGSVSSNIVAFSGRVEGDAQGRVAGVEADLAAAEANLAQQQALRGTSAGTPPAHEPHVTVVVESEISIPPYELDLVGRDVIRILGAIGVSTDWMVEEPSSDTAQPHSAEQVASGFVVRPLIVAHGVVPFASGEAILGLTPLGHHDSGAGFQVFYDTIHEFSREQEKTESVVLALVIAHEIGHVLLPDLSHADAGIMRTPWEGDRLNELLFTARQGELIRQRLNP